MRFKKTILFGGIGVLLCTPLLFLTTSCSATPSPLNTSYSINVGSNEFRVENGTIKTTKPISIGGKEYTSAPSLDDKDPSTYKANAVFSTVNTVGAWIYNLSTLTSQLISRSPTTKDDVNPINIPNSVATSGIDFALASYLGSGSETYRLGITSFNISDNLITDVENSVGLPDNNNANKPAEKDIILSNVVVNFGWWRSEGGNSTSMISQEKFDSINKDCFQNSAIQAKLNYSLSLKDITLKVQASYKEDQNKFPLTGGLNLNSYNFAGIAKIDDFINNVDYLIKAAQGDLKDTTFKSAIESEKGKYVNANIDKVIK